VVSEPCGFKQIQWPTTLIVKGRVFGEALKLQSSSFLLGNQCVKVYQASKRLSASQSHSCRKAESRYRKIFYVPQSPLTASKVTLEVPMSCNPNVCKMKEVQPLATLDMKQKISLSLMEKEFVFSNYIKFRV
jgi:hypothetical protein